MTEKYDYVTISKRDCTNGVVFEQGLLDGLLESYGTQGYRIIEKLYNSPEEWVLILSKTINLGVVRRPK